MARKMCINDHISEGLIFDILSRLPVKSLLRFKSVCKLWQFIISNPRFIQTHLANSHKNQAVLLNYRLDLHDHIEVHDTHQDYVKLYLPPYVGYIYCINSYDGLVCLSNIGSTVIYIWNPSIKRFKLLPTPDKQPLEWDAHIGLGFDSMSNDYKLLKIGFNRDPFDNTCGLVSELYSANADSWKEIQMPEHIYINFNLRLVSAKSGVLHMATTQGLLAFDLHDEVFRIYPFPNFEYSVRSDVLAFEGYVAMIFQCSNGSPLSLYVFDDVCGKVSWNKIFNLEADIEIDWVVEYLGFGQFIVQRFDVEYCVFNYDYKKGESKKIDLDLARSRDLYPFKYTESLVSLDGFQQV